MVKKISLVFIILLFSSFSFALSSEEFNIKVVEESSIIKQIIIADSEFIYNFEIPSDAKGISLKINDLFYDITGDSIILGEGDSLVLEYVSSSLIANNEILFNLNHHDSKKLSIIVELDEGSKLRYSTGQGNIKTSVYPIPYSLLSNGRNIIVKWELLNVKAGEFSGLILLEEDQVNYSQLLVILIILILLIVVLFLVYMKMDKKEKKSEISKDSKDITNHLKGDEKRVVQILKNKGGEAEQGTIRVVGNFSKSTLSRILSELEERNIIYKEKKGKKNLVSIK